MMAEMTSQLGTFVQKLFERRIPLRGVLGGPIEIASLSGQMARLGFASLIYFMAVLSLNLCLLNLLPIPILDGGQILILLVESTLRRDLSLRLKDRIFKLGLVMVVMLMGMALYFDVLKRLPTGGSGASEVGAEEALQDN